MNQQPDPFAGAADDATVDSDTSGPTDGAERARSADEVTFTPSEDVAVLSSSGGAGAESIHALRTHLAAKYVGEGKRGLAICASDAKAEAVFIAVNLAVSFSRAGFRTLLIDADMRTPKVHRYIVPSHEIPSLSQCLEDPQLSLGEAIQEDILPHLSVMYAGRSDKPQELLASARFKQIVDLCLRDFDVTIAIAPPSNVSADARRIASVMRYAMVVARKDVTYISDVNELIAELTGDGARVIGTILNAA